jgi:hypothetical protein
MERILPFPLSHTLPLLEPIIAGRIGRDVEASTGALGSSRWQTRKNQSHGGKVAPTGKEVGNSENERRMRGE